MGNRSIYHDKELYLEIKHTNLNQAKLVESHGQECLKVTVCLDRKDCTRWLQYLNIYQPHPTLFLPKQHSFSATQLCGNAGTVQILYPNYPHQLEQEFINRLNKSHEFTEPELWYLLLTLVVAKKESMAAGFMLGDIRPKNLLLNQHGKIKVPCTHSWPLEMNKFQKMFDNVPTYLSPEELTALQSGPLETVRITEAAEMYAMGLTMLSATNLKDYDVLYDCTNLKFDFQKFQEAITELVLNNRYSEVLRSTIMNLCSYQPHRRMALLQLWNLLGPHTERINAKTNFVIYNAPSKLHQEVNMLRSLTTHKTAQLPSELPQRTIQGLMSGSPSSLFDKLVPSHLNENTSSAMDLDYD